MTTIFKNTLLLTFEVERLYTEELRENIVDAWDASDGWKCGGAKTISYTERVPSDTRVTVSVASIDEAVKSRVEAAITEANAILRTSGLNRLKLPDYNKSCAQIPYTNKVDCTFELEGHPDLSDLESCSTIFVHRGIRGWYPDNRPTGFPFFGLDGELRSEIEDFPDTADLAKMETVFNLALMYLEEKGYIIDTRYSTFTI